MRLLVALFLGTIFSAYGQQLNEKQLVPFDGLKNDYFGRGIAISDSFLFVSSLRYENTIDASVYVYKYEDDDYKFIYKIFPDDPEYNALFGTRLLYENNRLFVGTQNKKVNNIVTGALYIFEYENFKWVEKQKITPPEPLTYGELFSNAISIYDDYLLISAFKADSGNIQCGKVFLYKYIDDKYEMYQEFIPFDAKEDQGFGTSVMIKDGLIIIGSSNDSTKSGLGSGSVYVYYKEDSLWSFKKKYIPERNSKNLGYGCALAINDDYIFVGTTDNVYYYGAGKVYIYNYSEYNLKLLQKIETGDNYIDDRFGISLFAKGDSLLVSAVFDTVKNDHPGAVYLFVNEKGEWQKRRKIVPSDEDDASFFGGRCILTDDKIFVGAHETRVNGVYTGAVYIYSSEPLFVIDENESDVSNFYLFQNYPNPFNSTTEIEFYLPEEGKVTIKIFDVTGREIKTMFNEIAQSGYHSLNLNLDWFPSGVYFYRIEYLYEENNKTHHSTITKKAVLIK